MSAFTTLRRRPVLHRVPTLARRPPLLYSDRYTRRVLAIAIDGAVETYARTTGLPAGWAFFPTAVFSSPPCAIAGSSAASTTVPSSSTPISARSRPVISTTCLSITRAAPGWVTSASISSAARRPAPPCSSASPPTARRHCRAGPRLPQWHRPHARPSYAHRRRDAGEPPERLHRLRWPTDRSPHLGSLRRSSRQRPMWARS
jgi:hypothetical protein